MAMVLFPLSQASAEMAVLPYRVHGASGFMTEESGNNHAYLVSLGASLTRKVEMLPWRDIEDDLKRSGKKAGSGMSTSDLASFGRRRYLQYIITGTLDRSDKMYHSSSILYSVAEERVVSRSDNSAGDLLTLAERDIDDLFLQFPKNTEKRKGSLDVALVFDSSLSMRKDWNALRDGAHELSSYALEKLMADARIYLVPFSDSISEANRYVSANSVRGVEDVFSRIRPLGDAGPEQLVSAMRYTVNSIRWREEAARLIVIVSNSTSRKGSAAERFSLMASKKGIRVCTITLGALGEDDCALYRRLADIGGGRSFAVSYHQKIYDEQGSGHELYFQRGRFFQSTVFSPEWKQGLLRKENSNRAYGEPLRFLDEIYFRESGIPVNAYSMPDSLKRIERVTVLRKDELENNIPLVMTGIMEKYGTPADNTPEGKVLLSDGKISLWIRPSDRQVIVRLKEYAGSDSYLNIGCTVRSAPGEAYGITLVPRMIIPQGEFLPDIIRVNLDEVVRNSKDFSGKGFLSPPLWFIRLKVDRLESFRDVPDARD